MIRTGAHWQESCNVEGIVQAHPFVEAAAPWSREKKLLHLLLVKLSNERVAV